MVVTVLAIINLVLLFQYPSWGLFSYLLIFLMRPGELFPALAPLRLELVVGAFALVSLFFNQKKYEGKVRIKYDNIIIAMLFMLVAMCLSIYGSFEMTKTVDTAIKFVKLVVFYYLIVSLIDDKKKFITFMWVFILIITYMSFDSFRLYLSGGFIHRMNVDRLQGTTSAAGDPNSLATTLIVTIPLILALATYHKEKLIKFCLYSLSLLMIALMVITGSRTGLVAFIGIIIAGFIYSRKKFLYGTVIIMVMIVGWVSLPDQYRERYMLFSEISQDVDQVSSGRWEIWKAGINMIPDRPILGVGAGAFAWAYGSGRYGPPQHMQSHNLYIEIFATMGIIGFIACSMFLFFLIKKLKILEQSEFPEDKKWISIFSRNFILSIISLLIAGLFGHNLLRYTWYMIAALATVMYYIAFKISEEEVVE